MNILRIIVSLAIIVAAGAWMSIDHLEKKVYINHISWNWDKNTPSADAWKLSTVILSEIDSELQRNSLTSKRKGRTLELRSDEKDKEVILEIVRDVNADIANFDEHNKGLSEKLKSSNELKIKNLNKEIADIEKIQEQLKKLFDDNNDGQLPTVNIEPQPEFKKEVVKENKKEIKPTQKKQNAIKVIIKDAGENEVNDLFSELLGSGNTEEENPIENSLKEMQTTLQSMKALISNSTAQHNQLSSSNYKNIIAEIASLEKLYQTLSKHHQITQKNLIGIIKGELALTYSKTRSLQLDSLNLLKSYLENKKIQLETTIANLKTINNPLPHYGKVLHEATETEAIISDIKNSYWKFLTGILVCLFFNLIIEILVQRKKN
jgi:hypothetical protein